MSREINRFSGKTNEYNNLFKGNISSFDDYAVCEYRCSDGRLTYFEGGLFCLFGIDPPDSLDELRVSARGWPFAANGKNDAIAYIESVVDVNTNSQRPFCEHETQLTRDGGHYWVNISAVSLSNNDSNVIVLIFLSTDKEKKRIISLLGQAEIDPLTGALNRSALKKAVERLISTGDSHAFIMMDVDGFKKLNDTFGHLIGDSVLVELVKKLREGLRREDVIGRLGGDEFMVCLRNVSDNAVVERLARHICVLARQSMPNSTYISASLGIAICPRDGTTFDELYQKIDIAMYNTKRRGGDGFTIYHPNISAASDSKKSDSVSAINSPTDYDYSALITFDLRSHSFFYPSVIEELFGLHDETRPLWQILSEGGFSSYDTAVKLHCTIDEICESSSPEARFDQYFLRSGYGLWCWYRVGFIRSAGDSRIFITLTDINDEIVSTRRLRHMAEYDELTGLLTRNAFTRFVENTLAKDKSGMDTGEYALVFFDVLRFKAINDMFGSAEGDRLLIYISDILSAVIGNGGAASRIDSDRFVLFLHKKEEALDEFINSLLDSIARYDLAFEVVINIGIYVTNGEDITVDAMLDRAVLAQSAIKGSYAMRYCYYNESLRNAMLSEQEIVGMMTSALADEQYRVYFQPQYDHSCGKIIGAEALVRWQHPERGLLSPDTFIPIFERNGFISELDFFVFEQVCKIQRSCIDSGIDIVPISFNLTRFDIFQHNFIEKLEATRTKYNIPVNMLRIEITETTIVGSNEHVSEMIRRLHKLGYVVEMDDFGSGYSSLNVLKDIDLDILKLDMKFVTDDIGIGRGGTILHSIVQMAKWLHMPVIAEGVENIDQADYLASIGCTYIQGYLYAKPMPAEQYTKLLSESNTSTANAQLETIEALDAVKFWNPASLETLIFSNYVGGADIFSYDNESIEVLRVNKKFLREIGGSMTEQDILNINLLDLFDSSNRRKYISTLNKAIETGDEAECECWLAFPSAPDKRICIRSNLRVIGRDGSRYLFYEMIRNVTGEKEAIAEIMHREALFRTASEQANIYYWEYDVATKEMRPCFRCMRDFGLPPVVQNYPEPVIENGVFPSDIAEMYREVMRRIDNGEKEFEAVMPLSEDHIPFMVRYTTEFDENGNPVKAYGSATLI